MENRLELTPRIHTYRTCSNSISSNSTSHNVSNPVLLGSLCLVRTLEICSTHNKWTMWLDVSKTATSLSMDEVRKHIIFNVVSVHCDVHTCRMCVYLNGIRKNYMRWINIAFAYYLLSLQNARDYAKANERTNQPTNAHLLILSYYSLIRLLAPFTRIQLTRALILATSQLSVICVVVDFETIFNFTTIQPCSLVTSYHAPSHHLHISS